MTGFLRWLVGVDSSPDWISGGGWRIELQSLPQSSWAAVALAVVLAALGVSYLYRREGREIGTKVRVVLASLRVMILLAVGLMLLEMVVTLTKKESVPSHLLVLVEDRKSVV